MTQDEMIELARQAGCFEKHQVFYFTQQELEAFAKLVAEKEREACAKIADEWAVGWPHPSEVIAERIRERT
jgi:predicted 3-demethylubiquinone-9 3-methyltransferase (glyoxalase superfamily)